MKYVNVCTHVHMYGMDETTRIFNIIIIIITMFSVCMSDKSTLERVSNTMYCCINGIFRELCHDSAMK